jgi:hypothetical protein
MIDECLMALCLHPLLRNTAVNSSGAAAGFRLGCSAMSRLSPAVSLIAPALRLPTARRALLAGGLLWGAAGFAAEKAAPTPPPPPSPPSAAPSAPAQPAPPTAPAKPGKPDFAKEVGPLIQKFCHDCHTGDEPEGDFSLYFETERDFLRRASSERAHFEKMYDFLREYEMPPRKKPQPTNAEREKILEWVEGTMLATPDATSLRSGKIAPGTALAQATPLRLRHPLIRWKAEPATRTAAP